MSFILDAIKKSEADRKKSQQTDIYSLQDQDIAGPSVHTHRSRWLLLCFALVILVLTGWYLWSPLLNYISEYDAANKDVSASVVAEDALNQKETFTPVIETASTVTADEMMPIYSINDSPPPNHQIKELWEQPVSFQNQLPTLDFAFHVYSEVAEQRTIIINDRRLTEGQMIARGLKLHTITESGVILFYQDRFFHVDVVTQW
ncbi:MAG: general secretion pathway protein GspB [Pseudomonadota bacterium]|nr:general secretion pathway protein GspB [Pseudomonadota bacterium]